MATKKNDDGKNKSGLPGQPDKDRRVTQATMKKIGRDAGSGQFIPVKQAQKRPKTAVVETIPKPTKKK